MRRIILVALSIALAPRLSNSQEAGPSVSPDVTADAPVAAVQDLVDAQLAVGEDRVNFKDRGAPLLGFKEKYGIRTRGGGVKAQSTQDGAARACRIALKETKKGLQPQCIILTWIKDYPDDKYGVEYSFRFDLTGKLEKAFRGTGKLTDAGESVKGSAILTALKVKDFEVQQRAREELDFWLKRTAKYMAKKRQQTSSGGGAVQPATAMQASRDAVAEPAAKPEPAPSAP